MPSISQQRTGVRSECIVNLAQLSPQVDNRLGNQLESFPQEQQTCLKAMFVMRLLKVGGEKAKVDILQFNTEDNKIYG